MTARTLIKNMGAGDLVEGVFAIHNCQPGQTKTGKPFLKCLIADKSARVPGRMWNATEQIFNTLPTDGFVRLEGQTQPYQGQMQIIIQQIRAVQPSELDLADLLPCTENDIGEMFGQLSECLATIEYPSIKALVSQYLDDVPLMEKFRQAPAAMELHHAYLGGLLEHTLNLLRLVDLICPLYPQLNRDIMLVGAFLHDMGKCAELKWQTGFGYTDEGQLVGHIARGVIWLEAKAEGAAASGQPVSEPVLRALHHIILSHHGRPEFGALKIPSTPEAIAFSMLDNLDAKMQMALRAAARDEGDDKNEQLGGHFTEKIWALETRLYRPDPTTVDQ